MSDKRYYITTPIYYVNGVPHIGTATTTLLADATKRYRRLRGDTPYFLTGTDEYARKVAEAAAAAGKEPMAFVDEVSARYIETWRFLNCDYDHFFRTTEPRHEKVVQTIFERLRETGDIYLGSYEGWYSVSDETFYRDTDVDPATGRVLETGAVVTRVNEQSYFFRLSAYGERLKSVIGAKPDFLQPETRRNEVLAYIEQGLRDIAITRNYADWGIPVPGETGKVIHVWFDALINYLTATGWPDDPNWQTLWPADVHLMGKEIYTRFHATLWPAMLLALDLPLPRHIVGHGWWLIDGEKGSKSKGNIPLPQEVVGTLQTRSGAPEAICVDALRYYLLRDIKFTDDAEFSMHALISRYNSDLANDLGNVLNRVLRGTYFDGTIPTPRTYDTDLQTVALETITLYENALTRFDWGSALQTAWTLVGAINKYLDTRAPWTLARNGDTAGVADVLYNALEGTRLAAVLLSPVLPSASSAIAAQLGIKDFAADDSWDRTTRWGELVPGSAAGTPTPLFPRIDTRLDPKPEPKSANKDTKKEKNLSDTLSAAEPSVPVAPNSVPPATALPTAPSDLISIDDFAKVQLRIASILSAERVEGAKKLLRLTIQMGEGEERQIVSGIADAYTPEELVGRQIVVVANLQPAVIRGVASQGMLVAATDEQGRAVLLQPDKPVAVGSKIR